MRSSKDDSVRWAVLAIAAWCLGCGLQSGGLSDGGFEAEPEDGDGVGEFVLEDVGDRTDEAGDDGAEIPATCGDGRLDAGGVRRRKRRRDG